MKEKTDNSPEMQVLQFEIDRVRLRSMQETFYKDPFAFAKDVLERLTLMLDDKAPGVMQRLDALKPEIHSIFEIMDEHQISDLLILAIVFVGRMMMAFTDALEEEEKETEEAIDETTKEEEDNG